MPKFTYAAVDATGATIEGRVSGETVGAVRATLLERDLIPLRIDEHSGSLSIELTKEKLKKRELMHFSRQLSVFVKAGIPIIEALETIAEEAQDKVMRKVVAQLIDSLRNGGTFAQACADQTHAFPRFYLGMLQSAELSGNLDDTLDKLSVYLERDIESRRKVVSALVYPGIVMMLALATVVYMSVGVIPQFEELYSEFEVDLPLSTRAMLGFSRLFRDLFYIPLTFFAIVLVWIGWMASTPAGKRFRDRMFLKLPVVKGMVEYSILERFCRILSAMVGAGVPLPEAMRVTSESAANTVFMDRLELARQQMIEGGGFSAPLGATGLFPGAAKQMFKVGEETGTLDDQLATAAIYFDRELDMRLKRFTAMFEPIMILGVGLVVGIVALSLVQSMYGFLGGVE